MRRFGAALASGEGDDLVQETWLHLLGRPAGAIARPRQWLASVMRNLARSRARGEGRRQRREEERPHGLATPSAADLAARTELEQLAVRAVLALEEPYRETLLLRYFEDLEPAAIAARLGVPGSTVRNRLARGLERVRAELDRQHGGQRGAWALVLLGGARSGAPLTTLSAAGAAGGLLMNLKWTVSAAGLALVALLLWVARDGGAVPRGEQAPVASATVELEPATRVEDAHEVPARREALADELEPATPTAAPDSAGFATLTVTVRWSDAGEPAVGLPVSLERWYGSPRVERSAATASDGRARFEGLPPGNYLVNARSTAFDWIELAAGGEHELALTFSAGVDVDVTVLDDLGVPVGSATVWLSDYGNDSSGVEAGLTDARGRLRLAEVMSGQSLAAFAPGHAPSAQHEVSGASGSELAVTLHLRGPGMELEGRVLDRDGSGISAARVMVGPEYPESLELEDGSQVTGPPPRITRTDAQGRFRLRGLEPGPLSVAARADGFAPARTAAEPLGETKARCELVLAPEARVAGIVRHADGSAAAGVGIAGGPYFDFAYVHARSASDGSYVLGGLASGEHEIRASEQERGEARTTLVLASGTETRWDPVLVSGTTLAGHVVDERGEPLADWHVAAVKLEHVGLWLRDTHSDSRGAFELVNAPREEFLLAVRSPEDPWGEPALLSDEFTPGQRDLVLVVPDVARPTARLRGRVLDGDGAVPAETQLMLTPGPGRSGVASPPDEDGTFALGPRPPGSHVLTVFTRDHAAHVTAPFTLVAGQELDLGTIVLEAPGYLRVRARSTDGPLPANAIAGLTLLRDGRWAGGVQFTGEQGLSGPLEPGNYVLSGHEDDWCAPDTLVTIAPGETSELELEFEPAGRQEFVFAVPPRDKSRFFDLWVRDERGNLTHHHWTGYRPGDSYSASASGLLPGVYSFEARTDVGRAAVGTFTVGPPDAPSEALVVALR